MKIALLRTATLLLLCASAAFAETAGTVTIRNEAYGYEVTVPKSWSVRKIVQEDPDKAMKSREFSFSITTGPEGEEPKNWNGLSFNNEGGDADAPPPVVTVYAHEKPGQTPAEFAKLIESTIEIWGGKMLKSEKTASGLDYTYDLFTKNRFVVRYDNGKRYVVQYMVPSLDRTIFDKYAPEVDAVVKSLRTR